MTEKVIRNENEAIECLQKNKPTSGYYMLRESVDIAIQAIKEIQQYRELGTVEEILKVFNNQRTIIASQHETLNQYRAIGTIEEFKVLKEKSVAKKQGNVNDNESHLRLDEAGFLRCGATEKVIRYPLISLGDLEHCPSCGQKLDWQ